MATLRSISLLAIVLCLSMPVAAAHAVTSPHLNSRIVIDGLTSDFTSDESIFRTNIDGSPQESDNDSNWGNVEDIHQIRITWDRANLYFAGEGIIYGNNMVVALGVVPGVGLSSMASLNSWRRNVAYPFSEFRPEVFGATWDGNTAPRLLLNLPGTSIVDDMVPGTMFSAVATFSQFQPGRAMEFRVPWETLFANLGGVMARDTVIGGVEDSIYYIPPHTVLRVAAFVTGADDGTGGPDVAPNNTVGCPMDYSGLLAVDNYAAIELDQDGDGLPDMGVSPISRVVFRDVSVPTKRETWGGLKQKYR